MSHFGSVTSITTAGRKPAMLLAVFVASAVALGGCARQQGPQEAQAAQAKPPPAYCQARPAPDCRLKGSTFKTVDPEEFARLKIAYERRCIRHAEKVERERMRQMHAAGACEGRPAPSLAASR